MRCPLLVPKNSTLKTSVVSTATAVKLVKVMLNRGIPVRAKEPEIGPYN